MFQISSRDGLWVKMINYKVQYWTGQFTHTVLDWNWAVSCRWTIRLLLFHLNSIARPRLIHIYRAWLDCTLTVASRIASTVISSGHNRSPVLHVWSDPRWCNDGIWAVYWRHGLPRRSSAFFGYNANFHKKATVRKIKTGIVGVKYRMS